MTVIRIGVPGMAIHRMSVDRPDGDQGILDAACR